MSGEMIVRAAVIAALRGDAALMERINGLFDGAPVRVSPPFVAVEEAVAGEWGAKGLEACEARLTIVARDPGDGLGALGPVMARVGAVMGALGAAGEGWRVVSARLIRSRTARAGKGAEGWAATMEYRVRAVRE